MQEVISELQRLRTRSRAMLVAQRCALVIACTLGVVVAMVAFDFVFRLPSAFRLVLLIGGVAALAYALWSYLRPAISFHPTLTQVALRIEHVLPSVSGRLASSVEFASAGVDQSNPLAGRAVRETQRRLTGESVGRVVNPARTRRDLAIMLIATAAAVTITILNPTAASTGLARLLAPYGDTKWPARTGVQSLMSHVVVGAGGDGGWVYARGQAMPLRASVTRGELDQRVEAHYRLKNEGSWQPWQRILLTHQGGGVHERLIDTNAEGLEVYFTTEDDQTSDESVELSPPPAVRRATLNVQPPAYAVGHVNAYETELGQGIDERSVTDTASLAGSQATMQLELNKPLPTPSGSDQAEAARWLHDTFGWENSDKTALPQFTVDSSSSTAWTLRWTLGATRTIPLHLRDEHGLANTEPIQYRIEAVEDRQPSVTITQPPSDETVLPTAVVGLKAEGRDDVALSHMGMEARVQASGAQQEQAAQSAAVWKHGEDASSAETAVSADLELAPLHLKKGDVVLVTGVAQDVYEVNGVRHQPATSPLRRLRVIDETDFATQLRRQLSAVRQNAIRIEAQQGEVQDDVIDGGVQPGMNRAQAQIGERIAAQRQAVSDVERLLRQNRLDDAQLTDILRQTSDLLDFAGRSANKAVGDIEKRQGEQASKKPGADASKAQDGANAQRDGANASGQREDASGNRQQQAGGQNQKPGQGQQPSQRGGEQQPQPKGGEQQSSGQKDQKPASAQGGAQSGAQSGGNQQSPPKGNQQQPNQQQSNQPQANQQQPNQPQANPQQPMDQRDKNVAHEAAPEDQDIVEAQQEVRDELADLIKLLDRDEDTWVVKQQLEKLAQQQADLEQQTRNLGQQTVGLKPEELTERQRSDADRITEKQRDLTQQARDLIEQLRERSQSMDKIDPQAAEAMRQAADTAEQQQLDRDMQQAAQQVQQNQMTSASASQQNAQRTMQKMRNDIEQTKHAQAQQLLRQLASLLESIQRLIGVQENEINALAVAKDANNFGGLDRNMIRLSQNTQSVAQEARSSGQEARRVARSLDRAADSQGAAVTALRAQPINAANAEEAETHSLELLKEAQKLAQDLQKQTAEQEVQRRREDLIEQYRKFEERQVALRNETVDLGKAVAGAVGAGADGAAAAGAAGGAAAAGTGAEQLDRRQLVEARRLGSQQEEIRTGLAGLRDTTSEIIDSPVFAHVHRLIDTWSSEVSDALAGGKVNVDVTDRQQTIADAIGRLIGAVEETMTPPPEFAQDQQNQNQDQQNGGQPQQQPLIPPVAQLKLLQGLQEQVYNLTKGLDGRGDLDDAQRRNRLRDLGQQQRDLGQLADQMLQSLENNRKPPNQQTPSKQPGEQKPDQPDKPGPGAPEQEPQS